MWSSFQCGWLPSPHHKKEFVCIFYNLMAKLGLLSQLTQNTKLSQLCCPHRCHCFAGLAAIELPLAAPPLPARSAPAAGFGFVESVDGRTTTPNIAVGRVLPRPQAERSQQRRPRSRHSLSRLAAVELLLAQWGERRALGWGLFFATKNHQSRTTAIKG